MPYDDPVVTHGWPRFLVLWSRVLIGLAVVVIALWVLSFILKPGVKHEVEIAEASVDKSTTTEAKVPAVQVQRDVKNQSESKVLNDKQAASDDYILVSEVEVLRVYFDIGSDIVPIASVHDLRPLIDYLITNKNTVAILSGYHDASGNKEINREISKKRAMAVRDFLVVEGVDLDRIILKKPQQSQGSGTATEARRVEVAVAKRQ